MIFFKYLLNKAQCVQFVLVSSVIWFSGLELESLGDLFGTHTIIGMVLSFPEG